MKTGPFNPIKRVNEIPPPPKIPDDYFYELNNRKTEQQSDPNYKIAIDVFKEIAQDANQSTQDRLNACKMLLEYI